MEKIKFQIEIKRVLDVLSKEIYDSPYALLRENIQNAYDAILMRSQYSGEKWSPQENGIIIVHIDNEKIIISDNGIGMSEKVLKDNYWMAGSSGKRTELALKSGVVGTFGIGAMANFGVCTKLKVETESIETKERIISEVERESLSLSEDCIRIDKTSPTGKYGTTITTTLDPKARLTFEQARSYLTPYVQYLPIIVELNGTNISQNSIEEQYRDNSAKIQRTWNGFEYGGIKADILVQCNEVGRVSATVRNISIGGKVIKGIICLRQDFGHLWGLRSSFGLAPVPISSFYSFGGVVNISVISPTAGREALSRESVEVTQRLIKIVEECATNTLAESEICNKSLPFMSRILSTGKILLANKLKVKVEPGQEMTLEELKEHSQKRKYNYYEGNDQTIIETYGTPDTPLIVLSRSSPRRQLESSFIQQFCKVEKVTDAPKILQEFSEKSYAMDEMSFVIKAKNLLEDDYALQSAKIKFANLTHNLPYIIQSSGKGYVEIYIQRNHPTIQPILKCYHDSYDVFIGLIKDYVRVHIYPRIQNWVPSSTREGAEALQKILKQKRELFEIKMEDFGMTSLFSDFMAGKVDFKDVVTKANSFTKIQTQEITKVNVGKMETEIPDLAESLVQPSKEENGGPIFPPFPAFLRTDVDTNKKLLAVEKRNPALNNFQLFFAISDRAFREEYDFFIAPHTTRIIWGGHRIIYIFTHASGSFSLYYDIEMFEDAGDLAGGGIFPTTTIVTKKRIFIPVPDSLKRFFELVEGKRSFYVRFDTISSY